MQGGEIDWDDVTIRNVRPTNFSAGFKNLQGRLATVQAAQLSNLFTTIFTTELKDDDDDTPFNPLTSLISLVVFPPKFTKAHLNTSFQSADIEIISIYNSTSTSPFQYAPQTNRLLVAATPKEMDNLVVFYPLPFTLFGPG